MFSDYAYLDQATLLFTALLFMIHRISVADGLKSLTFRTLKRVELKGIAIILLILSLITVFAYDCVATYVKYREGYYVDPVTGVILTRPLDKYHESDRRLFPGSQVLMNISLTLQCSALFLVMALWNHMSKAMLNRQFMSSVEFKLYAIYSLVSFAIYPFLQIWYYFSRDVVVTTLVPLYIYAFQCIVMLVLIQVSNWRFRKLIQALPENANAVSRIVYYAHMNSYLFLSVLITFIGLAVILLDSVTSDMLPYNKLLLDICSKMYMFGYSMTFPIAIMILCPVSMETMTATVRASLAKSRIASRGGSLMSVISSKFSGSSAHTLSPPSSPTCPEAKSSPDVLHRDTKGFFKLKKTTNISTIATSTSPSAFSLHSPNSPSLA